MMTPTTGPLSWRLQRNRYLIDSILLRRAPRFVHARSADALEDEVPVFCFHGVVPELFEEQCQHLVRNGYRTLSAAAFRSRLSGEDSSRDPAVLLTFDDGRKDVWTVAHPILEKHGLRATCFVVPGCIPEDDDRVRPTLNDVRQGKADASRVVSVHEGEPALATWAEILRMHDAGTFDFQSHTMFHTLVPTSERIFDFVGPDFDPYGFGNIHVPLYRVNGADVVSRDALPGLPIFYARPRMQAECRFVPDERLIQACISLVAEEGEGVFFARRDWRTRLKEVVRAFRRRSGSLGSFETPAERDRAVRDELELSRRAIERRVPGPSATHLCFPWYDCRPFALAAAREAGFDVAYFGLRPGRRTNRPGQDPMGVIRVPELFVERLPGSGRKSLADLLRRVWALRGRSSRSADDQGDVAT